MHEHVSELSAGVNVWRCGGERQWARGLSETSYLYNLGKLQTRQNYTNETLCDALKLLKEVKSLLD